jgi:AcrR family transcriptional regulator
VCIEADLGPRYFYESFNCKDELVLAVYEQLQANLIATVTFAMGDASEQCLTRLNRSIEGFLQFFKQNTHVRWILLFDSVVPSASSKDSNWRLLLEYEAVLVDELKRGALGRLGDRAAQAMACGLLGATIQLTVHWLFLQQGEPVDETLAVLRFIYAAAIQSLSPKD